MSCLINSAFTLDCISGIGGVKKSYFLGGEITAVTEANGELTNLTGTGSFYEFALPRDTAFFNETTNVSPTNGTIFYQQELTIILQKLSAAKRNQILLLAQSRNLQIVFVDNNDVNWIMGLTRGAQMTAGASATGTAPGDLNGYTLTFQGIEPQPVYPLSGDLADCVTGITVVATTTDNPVPTTTTTTTTTGQ